MIKLLTEKGNNAVPRVLETILINTSLIQDVLNAFNSDNPKLRYGSSKTILLLSEQKPELLYPFFPFFIKLLSSENIIIKCTAIDIICNLSYVDIDNKIDENIIKKLIDFITCDSQITASHVVENIWKLTLNGNLTPEELTKAFLRVSEAHITSECKNVLAGHIIESFSKFFDLISNDAKKEVLAFAKFHTTNTRIGTRKKAEQFIKQFIR